MVALIAVVCIIAVDTVGEKANNTFDNVGDRLP